MKLPKYNLDYNTRDLMNTLAKSASDRKCKILSFSLIGYKGLLLSVFLGKLFGEDRSNC